MNASAALAGRPAVLVFCRKYLVDSFRASAAPLAAEFDFQFLTDGICPGTSDTRVAFYAALEAGARSPEIGESDEADVIDRCRMLRNIDRATASRLVHAMAVTLGGEIDRARPACVLSQMVDEYVTHVLSLLAARRGIGYVGYCAGYFPGSSLLLADAYGRPFEWRDADEREVEDTLADISPQAFRQNYNLRGDYHWRRHLFSLFRYRVKRLVFWARGRLQRDPWNIHYAVTPYIAERRRLRDYPFESRFHKDWATRMTRARAERPGAPVVYLPLGYFPESTIDYWIGNKRAIDYEFLVLEMARTLGRDCIVVVKEHLHMMGARNAAFLKALAAVPGVISAHPRELSNEIVAASDAVLLGSGSPGIEATVRGKPVFSFCETSYWFEPANAVWMDLDRIDTWSAQIRSRLAAFEAPGPNDLKAFVRACLKSSTRIDPKSTIWPLLVKDDLRAVLRTAIMRAKSAAGARALAS